METTRIVFRNLEYVLLIIVFEVQYSIGVIINTTSSSGSVINLSAFCYLMITQPLELECAKIFFVFLRGNE